MQYILAGFIGSGVLILGGCAAMIPAAHTAATAVAAHAGAATVAVGAGAGAVTVLAAPGLYKTLKRDQDNEGAAQDSGNLGAFLATSQAEVRVLVQRAKQAQREVLVVAGVRAQNVLARGRVAFKDSLSLSASALGEQEKQFKSELESLITNLYSPVDMTVKDAGERAQAIAYRLRPSSAAPLLNASGPIFLFSSMPFQSITVRGNFPSSYTGEAVPRLSIDGKSFKAFEYGGDRIGFNVPTTDLDAADTGQILWKTGVISVPWVPSSNFFSTPEIEPLAVEFAILPGSFGRMSIDHAIITVRTEEKTRISREFPLDAGSTEATNRQCLVMTPQELADGWRIKSGTSAFVPSAGQAGPQNMGAWMLNLVSETEQAACWSASTFHTADAPASQTAAAGGLTSWKISSTIWREVKDSGTTQEHVDLAWGSQHHFKYPAGTWKLRYSRTGSGEKELTSADASQPLIRVSTDASGVAVSIYPF